MADKSICKIEGCDKPACNVRGWCKLHYGRWIRHGDPLILKKPHRAYHLTCSVDGCGRPVKSLGFCNPHYIRFSRYGNPLSGGTEWGAVRRWLENVACQHGGDECLIFPYYRRPDGYGHIRTGNGYMGAHVYVAEKCHGPKPSARHEACHSCGRGSSGCVSPGHLYWGTRKENVHDAIREGSFKKPPRHVGAKHPNAKFSDTEIAEMLKRVEAGETMTAVALSCGISVSHLGNIRKGRSRASGDG